MRLPGYQLHRATGQARVSIRGRDHYLGPHGSEQSKARYAELIRQLKVEAAQAEAKRDAERRASSSDSTIQELIPDYLEHCMAYYRKGGKITSQIHAIRSALRVLRRLHGEKLAATFGPLALKSCQAAMVEGGLSRPGVNKRVGLIRQFFRWASAEELVPPEVYHGLQALAPLRAQRTEAPEPDPVGPVDLDQVEAVLPHVSAEVAAMIRLQLLTGMRPAEVCGMTVGDVVRFGEGLGISPHRP